MACTVIGVAGIATPASAGGAQYYQVVSALTGTCLAADTELPSLRDCAGDGLEWRISPAPADGGWTISVGTWCLTSAPVPSVGPCDGGAGQAWGFQPTYTGYRITAWELELAVIDGVEPAVVSLDATEEPANRWYLVPAFSVA
ncbi:hypothetical protein Acsp05_28340 [Actinokineospora sp. NBRC 105648]|nr:hypothetical protein Acsp05_28340 [Actinokineospora sp. NBRC 105648]